MFRNLKDLNNKLTAHELRELAKVLEMAVTDTIRFVEKESNKKIWEYIIFIQILTDKRGIKYDMASSKED